MSLVQEVVGSRLTFVDGFTEFSESHLGIIPFFTPLMIGWERGRALIVWCLISSFVLKKSCEDRCSAEYLFSMYMRFYDKGKDIKRIH